MDQEPAQAATSADMSSEHVEHSDPFSLIESVPASPAVDAASERSWDFSEWVRGQADRPSLGEPSDLGRESCAPAGAEMEVGIQPSLASNQPASELPGASYDRMSYERLLNASHMSLDREVPKLFWQEGFGQKSSTPRRQSSLHLHFQGLLNLRMWAMLQVPVWKPLVLRGLGSSQHAFLRKW